MKKARCSEDQIVRILREADSCLVTQAAKKYGVIAYAIGDRFVYSRFVRQPILLQHRSP